jgi:hypothetical protein
MQYLKTYDFPGEFINSFHGSLAVSIGPSGMIDIGVEGWLLPADALKLYELAYFCYGDILELGTYRGLYTKRNCRFGRARNRSPAVMVTDLMNAI